MNRAVLQACLPAFIALGVAFALLTVLVRFSGAKLNLKRLRDVGRCNRGSVQSLSLVLTLPLFVMVVLFILQVSQLMVARIVIEYAAFAAARAAIVWVPAQVSPQTFPPVVSDYLDPGQANVLPQPFSAGNPVVLAYNQRPGNAWSYESPSVDSLKYQNIFESAAIACASMAPSRPLLRNRLSSVSGIVAITQELNRSMNPGSTVKATARQNKLEYSFDNTSVQISFQDKNSAQGPTYNKYRIQPPIIPGFPPPCPIEKSFRNEIGWQDPLTVTVEHNFALLPGPGRFLAGQLVGGIVNESNRYRETVHSVVLRATAKLTNEGLKPVIRYRQGP